MIWCRFKSNFKHNLIYIIIFLCLSFLKLIFLVIKICFFCLKMKYQTQCIINSSINEVIAVFEDLEKLKYWQKGLKSSTLIKGGKGEVGSKRRFIIKLEGQEISMIETITFKNLPHQWHGRYTSNGLESIQQNYFTSINENQTKWVSKSEFVFSGWMILVSKVLPGIFKKRSETIMADFKNYVENGIDVSVAE